MFWMLSPTDERINAVVLDNVQALCGVALPAGQERRDRPWGNLCMPCVIGATADLPDPGPGGSF